MEMRPPDVWRRRSGSSAGPSRLPALRAMLASVDLYWVREK
jgi:hypothetical protein